MGVEHGQDFFKTPPVSQDRERVHEDAIIPEFSR
jgi:hypothetical protein